MCSMAKVVIFTKSPEWGRFLRILRGSDHVTRETHQRIRFVLSFSRHKAMEYLSRKVSVRLAAWGFCLGDQIHRFVSKPQDHLEKINPSHRTHFPFCMALDCHKLLLLQLYLEYCASKPFSHTASSHLIPPLVPVSPDETRVLSLTSYLRDRLLLFDVSRKHRQAEA